MTKAELIEKLNNLNVPGNTLVVKFMGIGY